jgi:hypothetical protein
MSFTIYILVEPKCIYKVLSCGIPCGKILATPLWWVNITTYTEAPRKATRYIAAHKLENLEGEKLQNPQPKRVAGADHLKSQVSVSIVAGGRCSTQLVV